jgi:hypothetical protein
MTGPVEMAGPVEALRSALARTRHPFARMRHPFARGGSVSCAEAASALQSILEGGERPRRPVVEHVEYCLSCQAELARYRKVLRLMQQLRASDVVVPTGIVGDVLSALEEAAGRRAVVAFLTGRRIAYGAAVVAAAGAGAALVLVARRSERVARAGRACPLAGAHVSPSL